MKTISLLALLLGLLLAASTALHGAPSTRSDGDDAVKAVKAVLSDFRLAKTEQDEERFYGHLASDAIVFGTDAPERWTVEELRAVMAPYFAQGASWKTTAAEQNVFLSPDEQFAWFDEPLTSERFGEMRSSGVLRLEAGQWKIVQYNIVFIVPNELALDLLKMVSELEKK